MTHYVDRHFSYRTPHYLTHRLPFLFLKPVANPALTTDFLSMMDARRRELRARQSAVLFSSTAPAATTASDSVPSHQTATNAELAQSPLFTWEIGCGHGHFLTGYAQTHPDEICIGIDIVSERIGRAVRKRDRAKLANLHFFHAEAHLFLETLPHPTSFTRLFILFPDPWPKLRHHKHRILRRDFLTAAAARAAEGAHLYFRTDYLPYFDEVRAMLSSHLNWLLTEEPWPFEHDTVFQSRAEQFYSLVAKLRHPMGH